MTVRSTANVGQEVTVIMTVSNTGLISATSVTFPLGNDLAVSGPGATRITGPNPAPGISIPVGQARSFTWTYSADGAGLITFSQTAEALDGVGSTTTAQVSMTAQNPATLVSFWASPAKVLNLGQTFTTVITVSNTGDATANNVFIRRPTLFPHELYLNSGNAANSVDLPPAFPSSPETKTFTFIYDTSGTSSGTIIFSNHARGEDSNALGGFDSIGSHTSPATDFLSETITLQAPASLQASWGIAPASVNLNQLFTVTLTLSNSGQAGITGLQPNPAFSNFPAQVVAGADRT